MTRRPTASEINDDQLDALYATNQRLNLRTQDLESELAAYRRAVAQWEVSERGTYVPLRTIAAIAKAAGRDIETPQWLLHYQRVEQAEAAVARVRGLATRLEAFAENALRTDDRNLYAAIAHDLRTRIDGPAAQRPPHGHTDPKETAA